MKKVDMHMHSTVSDGFYTIDELVKKAKDRKLDGIIITDHDTLSHLRQLPIDDELIVKGGVEVSCFDYEKKLPCTSFRLQHQRYR